MTVRKHESKTLIILNPAAGKGKGKKCFDSIKTKLESSLGNLEICISEYPGHLEKLSYEAVCNGFDRLISIGGDGTPFEIINGVYKNGLPDRDIYLGMLPAGTGNSFLRDFDKVDPDIWLDKILAGSTKTVDLVEFSYFHEGKAVRKYYLNILGIGLIADILKLTNEKLKFLGRIGYSVAVLTRLFQGMNNRIKISIDNRPMELVNSALVISNSKYTGGGMKIAPMADVSDGKVDMIIFNSVNRRNILSIFARVFKGTHVDHPRVTVSRGAQIQIEGEPQLQLMADGELLGETPLRINVLPRQLNIFA